MSFIEELKRRNVFKVGAAYVVMAWLLAQGVDVFLENFGAPDWVIKTVLLLLVAGFPVALFFAWAFELTPEGIKKEKDVDRSQSITHETGRKLDFAIIGILLVALGYFAFDKFLANGPAPETPATSTVSNEQEADSAASVTPAETTTDASPGAAPISEKSIAVLPFVNMSSDPEQEYFSDGISEELLNALASVDELKVAGRTSSFAFKGQNQDFKAIGEALRVAHILEGSVRKSGNQLRITAQLIKVDDGYHLWSQTFDREMTDVFAIQDEISNAILVQLKAQLLGGERLASKQADPQAYAQYLLAKQRIYERSQASLELASSLLRKAVEIDPGFAAAYAQLGISTILLSKEQYGEMDHQQAYELGRQYLEQALALDPQQAEAMAGMGLYWGDKPGQGKQALEWLERSLESDPNQTNASNWMANYLRNMGHIRQSIALREKDFSRDPLYMPVFSNLVQMYMATGQTDRAQTVIQDLEPYLHDDANMMLTKGMFHQVQGQWALADEAFSRAHEKEPKNFVNNLWLCVNLNATGQYQRCADLDTGIISAFALNRLGRTEEALINAYDAVGNGANPGWLFQMLVEEGRHQELVEFVESRWTDLDAFRNDFPGLDGWGSFDLNYIAEAYARIGRTDRMSEALQHARQSNDLQLAEGADNWSLSLARAHVAMIAGNPDEAITLLERAVDQGYVEDLSSPKIWPAFKPLRGDPRFETARQKILDHLNEERRVLKLEPVTT